MRWMAVVLGAILFTAPALAAAPAECTCSDFDALQQELDTAKTLRVRHQAKAEEMERRQKAGESAERLKEEYSGWESDAQTGAGAGIIATRPSGQTAIGYVPRGARLMEAGQIQNWSRSVARDGYEVTVVDPDKARAIEKGYAEKGQDLCEFAEPAAVERSAQNSSICAGVARILVEHERSHRATCRRMGFISFYFRSAAELARDEVVAYDAQIAALQAALGVVLKGAQLQFEDESHMAWSAKMINATYDFRIAPTRGAIPDNDGRNWSVKLKGIQRMTSPGFTAAGTRCTITGYSRDVWLTVNARSREAAVTFDKVGAIPAIRTSCPALRSHGGSMAGAPETIGQGFTVPLALAAGHEEDLGASETARIAAASGIKVTGYYRAKLAIICPAAR